ncbi:MAG TPA: preprotein translocase subunit SecG, partial [Gammaproteobacteria bacterium]|nr:preprotein translocase subunit SecG [Gammaproteobacteria bacterium]
KQKADAAGAFGLPDVPAQSLESVIQEPVAPKTVD